MFRRAAVTLSAACLVVLLGSGAASGAQSGVGARARIAVPTAGHFSFTPISVRTNSGKKPRLHIVGSAGKLVVAGGLAADPKVNGRYVGAVILINRKTTKLDRSVQSATHGATTFIVVDAPGSDVVVVPSLHDAICMAKPGDTIIGGSTFLANPPGSGINPFMDAGFASSCGGRWGDYSSASGTDYLDGLARGPYEGMSTQTPDFSCKLSARRDPVVPTIELNIFVTCSQPVTGAVFTFPSGNPIGAFLPSTGMIDPTNPNVLRFTGVNWPANTPQEVDARSNSTFGPNSHFFGTFTGPGGTASADGVGPP